MPDDQRSMEQKYKRAYKACMNCRRRKVRCIFEDSDPPPTKCSRCRRENKQCVVPETTKRGGIRNVLVGKARKQREEMIRGQVNVRSGEVWKQRELYNSADALHLLSQLARSLPRNPEVQALTAGGADARGGNSVLSRNGSAEPQNNLFVLFPPGDTVPLDDTAVVKELGVITSYEARLLVKYFIENMSPYYAFVPEEYSTADKIAAMPLLLATITCLAVRYFVPVAGSPSQDFNLYNRRAAVHVALWEYCQRLLSQAVWTEASNYSVSTVLSFLLLTEWNPTAIHIPQNDSTIISGNEHSKVEDWLGIGASRRSDRMAWLLLGQAVRLAQDIGLMDTSPTLYLAMHTSEIVLACRLGRAPMLSKFIHDPLPDTIKFNREQVAQIEVLQIMALANETLYSSRAATRELVRTGRYIFLIKLLAPKLDSWYEKYKDMLQDDSIFTEDVIFGYNHTRLYIFSLALMPVDGGASIQNFAVLRPSAQFVAMAIEAAKNVIGAATRLHARGALKFMPIRWVMRLIHAIVFLVKSLLLTAPVFQQETPSQILDMIRDASQMLLNVGPDRYHVCRHYGTVLLNLCTQFSKDTASPEPSESPAESTESPMPTNEDVKDEGDEEDEEEEEDNNQISPFTKATPVPMMSVPQGPAVSTIDDTMTFGMDIDFLLGAENFDFVENTLEQLQQRELFE